MLIRLSVKRLAEFAHRRGDLYPSLGGRVTAEEGMEMQRQAQRGRGDGYVTETVVDAVFEREDFTLHLSGRVDGTDLHASPPLVEEIKATRAEATDAEEKAGSAHWAQATLYAALLSLEHPGHDEWLVRLLYCHPDTGAQEGFDRRLSRESLCEFLEQTIGFYEEWMRTQLAYQAARNAWIEERSFPYGEFRLHQRALSGRVFRALREREHLLLEAPTGSGKTMGVLYPALKAQSQGLIEQLFFLTSRGTGAIAVLDACVDLAQDERRIRVVDLVAKEKACPVPGMPCDESCDYARGYYDRIHGAVAALLEHGHMTAHAVQSVAEAHQVCPFELSLDAALWADLVIGDYNYLLDPVVRLQRFSDHKGLALLIDESHQLADRTRSMLSVKLRRRDVRLALKEPLPAGLGGRLRGVDRALLGLRRSLPDDESGGRRDGFAIEPPTALTRAVSRALEALADEHPDLLASSSSLPLTRQLMFDLSRWHRSLDWMDPDHFRYFADSRDAGKGVRDLTVTLSCLDPAGYLQEVLETYGPHIRFSGTVSPLPLYQTQHGQAEAAAERVASLFEPRQLAALIVSDLPVYYRQRSRSLPRLVQLIADVVAARPGNYLVALPSFEYLDLLNAALSATPPAADILTQVPGMADEERAAFIESFRDDGRTRLGLVVLGGVFAESVDFSNARLSGAVVVGVGLPPTSAFRESVATHFEEKLGSGGGELVAYTQPAMAKVLQMAGRLLRGPTDRAALVLVDDRFGRAEYQRFFPEHWRPERCSATAVTGRLEAFWADEDPGFLARSGAIPREVPPEAGDPTPDADPSITAVASLDCVPPGTTPETLP